MCILLLPARVYWLLFVFYLIGCKIGVGGPCVYARLYKYYETLFQVRFSKLVLYIIIIIIIINVSCHRPFLPGTSLGPAVIPTAQASSFTLQYFPYYV